MRPLFVKEACRMNIDMTMTMNENIPFHSLMINCSFAIVILKINHNNSLVQENNYLKVNICIYAQCYNGNYLRVCMQCLRNEFNLKQLNEAIYKRHFVVCMNVALRPNGKLSFIQNTIRKIFYVKK